MQSIRQKWESMRVVALHITANNNTLAKLLAKHLAETGLMYQADASTI
jgi:hypothetical protein